MLPKRKDVFAVFHLAQAARLKRHRHLEEWVNTARALGSYTTTLAELQTPAQSLLQLGFAREESDGIMVSPKLIALSDEADRATLQGLARLLLAAHPPFWIRVAVTPVGISREYIPSEDFNALRWLEPDLEEILKGIQQHLEVERIKLRREAIDAAAELYVMAALNRAGENPVHVSRLSDSYGYDIETRGRRSQKRIKVKAAVTTATGSFYITRNEYDKSQIHGSQWCLIQVVFSSAIMVSDVLDHSHVEGVFELTSEDLQASIPADTPSFIWNGSAFIMPSSARWRPAHLPLDPTFTTPGFNKSSRLSF